MLINVHLDKFIVKAINWLKPEQTRLLGLDDQKKLYTKGFWKKSLQDKLSFLGKIGYGFAIIIYPRNIFIDNTKDDKNLVTRGKIMRLFNILQRRSVPQNTKTGIKEGIDLISELNVFAMCDAEFFSSCQVLSTIHHSKTHLLIKDYDKLANAVDKTSYNSMLVEAEEIKLSIEYIDKFIISVARTFYSGGKSGSVFEKTFGISFIQYEYLSYISLRKTLLYSGDLIKHLPLSPVNCRRNLVRMLDKGLLTKHQLEGGDAFTLTGTGVLLLQQIRDSIIKNVTQ